MRAALQRRRRAAHGHGLGAHAPEHVRPVGHQLQRHALPQRAQHHHGPVAAVCTHGIRQVRGVTLGVTLGCSLTVQPLHPLVRQQRHVVGQGARVAPAAQLGVGERRQLLAVAVLLAPEEGSPRRRGRAPLSLAFQGAHRPSEHFFHPVTRNGYLYLSIRKPPFDHSVQFIDAHCIRTKQNGRYSNKVFNLC